MVLMNFLAVVVFEIISNLVSMRNSLNAYSCWHKQYFENCPTLLIVGIPPRTLSHASVKKVIKVLRFTCNVWMLICVNCVLVLPLTYPPVSTLEQLWTFKQIVLSFMLYPSHTAPLSITAQILHSNLP